MDLLVTKDVIRGFALPLLIDIIHKIPTASLAPLNVTNRRQSTKKELGIRIPKLRMTHDRSFPGPCTLHASLSAFSDLKYSTRMLLAGSSACCPGQQGRGVLTADCWDTLCSSAGVALLRPAVSASGYRTCTAHASRYTILRTSLSECRLPRRLAPLSVHAAPCSTAACWAPASADLLLMPTSPSELPCPPAPA